MTETTLCQFKTLFPASATPSVLSARMVPIRLKLLNTWGKHTLDDLTKLVGLLGIPGTHLHLSRVEEGCIAVTWLCSTSDVRELKQAIDQAAGSLQVVGVLQIFTGEEMILDCRHQPDQPQGPCLTKIYFTIRNSQLNSFYMYALHDAEVLPSPSLSPSSPPEVFHSPKVVRRLEYQVDHIGEQYNTIMFTCDTEL